MNDLGFIKECDNCKHNISYTKFDYKTKYEFIGYIISCKVWGTEDAYNTEVITDVDVLIGRINSIGCSDSPTKIIKKIYKVYKKIIYLECPNCKENIIMNVEQVYKSWPKNTTYDTRINIFYFSKSYQK